MPWISQNSTLQKWKKNGDKKSNLQQKSYVYMKSLPKPWKLYTNVVCDVCDSLQVWWEGLSCSFYFLLDNRQLFVCLFVLLLPLPPRQQATVYTSQCILPKETHCNTGWSIETVTCNMSLTYWNTPRWDKWNNNFMNPYWDVW